MHTVYAVEQAFALFQRQIAGERTLGTRGIEILKRIFVQELGFRRELLIKAADAGCLARAGCSVQAEFFAAGARKFGFVAG